MKQFFKQFLASLLALFIFSGLAFLIILISVLTLVVDFSKPDAPKLTQKSILVIDLENNFAEYKAQDWGELATFFDDNSNASPNLLELTKLIEIAANDSFILGLYLKGNYNSNSLASSEEIRRALSTFKKSKKPILAFSETISQKSYYLFNIADKIYSPPTGMFSWEGYSAQYTFFKKLFEKLEIEPQIFYAGKYKSFTEPFRLNQMSDENKTQTSILLNQLYSQLLITTASARNIDTHQLHILANQLQIEDAPAAHKFHLIDEMVYEPAMETIWQKKLNLKKEKDLKFLSISNYFNQQNGNSNPNATINNNKIALVYLIGDIVDGQGNEDNIGSQKYKNIFKTIRKKIKEDKEIKALVLRINSPGGSALASDILANEIQLIKKEVPVVVSMAAVAASGGYYLSCLADKIVADYHSITGSIGVFTIIPNTQKFFNNKVGIAFDGVSTNPNSQGLTITKPLNGLEKRTIQNAIDSIYIQFKRRVAQGRNIDIDSVESLAQGRVWTAELAQQKGLIDELGDLQTALKLAQQLAHINSYNLETFPKSKNILENLINEIEKSIYLKLFADKDFDNQTIFYLKQMKDFKQNFTKPMMKLPSLFTIYNN